MKDQDLTVAPADNIIPLFPAKKESVRPADPTLIKPAFAPKPGEAPDLMFVPYPDGVLFRCSPKPGASNGAFLIHDSAGTIVAVTCNQNMANLFCEALHIYFQAAKQHVAEQTVNSPVAGPEAGK